MFIDQNPQNTTRRSQERNVSSVVLVYLSSAPANGARGYFLRPTINIRPLTGSVLFSITLSGIAARHGDVGW
jgi:hypothetical protein